MNLRASTWALMPSLVPTGYIGSSVNRTVLVSPPFRITRFLRRPQPRATLRYGLGHGVRTARYSARTSALGEIGNHPETGRGTMLQC